MNGFFLAYDGSRMPIEQDSPIVIGRSGFGASVEIDDEGISRLHARIELRDGRVFVKDLLSANGVSVNNEPIPADQWIAVDAGDAIGILDYRFTLHSVKQSTDSPTPDPRQGDDLLRAIEHSRSLSIGRAEGCDVTLDDSTVSRLHARITFDGQRYWVEDLKSTNGTFLHDKPIRARTEIGIDDEIVISLFKISVARGVVDLQETRAAISAVSISKTYPNGKIGLQPLSIDIASGSIVALMGPSGCGKSTLLKCLNGDNPASTGQVFIHGLPLTRDNYGVLKKKIGYVPQDDIIHKELSVYKTLYYAAKIRLPDDTTEQEIKTRIERVINSLSLDQDQTQDIRDMRVKDLSGGQRKRISIAVELLIEPSILFLDEPTSPLDPESINSFLSSLQQLAKEGTTIIMVTHKPEDLHYTNDVIFLMIGGYAAYHGASNGLLARFGVNDIVEVYAKLSDTKQLQRNVEQFYQRPEKRAPGMLADHRADPGTHDSPILQWFWLTARYLETKISDAPNLGLLLLQPVIIAGLLCIIFDELQVGVLFLMAVSSIWFGVSNAAKEIVGELSVYQRERMFNLGIHTYVLAKLAVLSAISFVQTLLFVTIVYYKFFYFRSEGFDDIYLRDFNQLIWFMFFVAVSSTLIGLFLSAALTTTERVMTVVPISLMPQVMLGGLVARINDPIVEFFSFFTLGRWGTEGLARIQDAASPLHTAANGVDQIWSVISFIPGENTRVPSAALDLLNYYDAQLVADGRIFGTVFDSMAANVLSILLLNIAFYALIYAALKRKDRF